jgi:DNA modification methylase
VAFLDPVVTDRYAIYNGDSMDMMRDLPSGKVHFSIYSPPFAGLYKYSDDERDLSNCGTYEEFRRNYLCFVEEIHRLTMPGRLTAVHCADVPSGNSGVDHLRDFPGDVIRLHEEAGWQYVSRVTIWKEPLWVRNRYMIKNLAHRTIVDDAARAGVAGADYLLTFRKRGKNPVPIENPQGLLEYAGECPVPEDLLRFKGWKGKQTENRYSHWIWRRYASSIWDDIRMRRVVPYRETMSADDEKHVHPLQRDVIHRAIQLRTNPGETVLTPFAGVGSELVEAVEMGRLAIAGELKTSYYRQLVLNAADAAAGTLPDVYADLELPLYDDGEWAMDGEVSHAP